MNLSARIFTGLVLGLALGALAAGLHGARLDLLLAVARPIGKLWLDALTMTVVPLVFGLIVTGILAAAREAASGRIARDALIAFAVLLFAATAISAVYSSAFLHWLPVPAEAQGLRGTVTGSVPSWSEGSWVDGIIPTNPIRAAADMAMVPLVVFALVFGFAAARIAPELSAAIGTLFRAVVEAMLVIVHWVLWLAPLGVLALAFTVGARLGVGAAGALLHYVLVAASACLVIAILAYPLAVIAGRVSPARFARAALPSQVVAVSTQSSLASLPAMIEGAAPLGVAREAAGVVLPLAVSLFRAASAAANMAVVVYLGHLHGVAMGPGVLAVGAAVAAVTSIAAVGLPAQVSFFAMIGPVCLATGVPIELLPLLLAVETIPDIFRTLGNVTTDLAVTAIVGRRVSQPS